MIYLVLRVAMLPYRDLGGARGVSRCAATNSGWTFDAELQAFIAWLSWFCHIPRHNDVNC